MLAEVREVFERLEGEPDDLVLGKIGTTSGKVRWVMLRAIEQAGLTTWPKMWINMRSSLVTDMSNMGYSAKALDSFFGNSEKIRRKHYEQFDKDKEYEKILSDNESIISYLRVSL